MGCGTSQASTGYHAHFWTESSLRVGSVVDGWTLGGICTSSVALKSDGVKVWRITAFTNYGIGARIPLAGNPTVTVHFGDGTDKLKADICAANLPGNTVPVYVERDGRQFPTYLPTALGRCVTGVDLGWGGPGAD